VSLVELLDDGDGRGPQPLLHLGSRSWTRDEVRALVEQLAGELTRLGVERGECVGVMLPSGASVVAAWFGVWRLGAVVVPLNPRLTDAELAAALAATDPTCVVADGERDALAGMPLVVASGEGWHAEARPRRTAAARHDEDVALVQFTSGTTGRPKPVLLRHSGVLTLLDNVLSKLRGDRRREGGPAMANLVPVSLSLWAGIYNVLFALRVGAPIVVMERFETAEFARLVREHEIRSVVLPPAAMTMLADDTSITALAPLKIVRSITAPLSPVQARRFKDRFSITVLNSYGQTEIGGEIIGWNAADAREHGDDKLGSVGRPHRGVEVKVVDSELRVRTPVLTAGYADGAALGDRLDDEGWFRTGDHGWVDEDGFVWIEGRVSEMINRGGLKVAPEEVEEVLRSHGAVGDVAVVRVPDDRLGEVPWAFVVAAVPNPDADELVAHCRERLAPFKVPAGIEWLPALPRNEVGKVLRGELTARARS